MNSRSIIPLFAGVALGVLSASRAVAHEGHVHQAMGWVAAISAERLDLKTSGDEVESFVLAAETKYVRGTAAEAREKITVGERAVVRYEEKAGKKVAKEVRVAEAEQRHAPEAHAEARSQAAVVQSPAGAPVEHQHQAAPVASAPREPEPPPTAGTAEPGHHGDHAMMGLEHATAPMHGRFGPYPQAREASGTSWQPDSTPHLGRHLELGPWMVMLHGFADVVWDAQGGERGEDELFSGNMGMLMAQRPLGSGTLGLRAMASLEPATIGKRGYPLLLQTGETADGRTHLIDRQHPHDFLMELGASYSVPVGEHGSAFAYLALPGEPALGPPVYMHRFSGEDIPEAPIGHHWLDSTHITFGVATLGYVRDRFKVEGSLFTGREPDEQRWNIDSPKFDSYSARVSWNPTGDWALQASWGRLKSPEELEPDVDVDRTTASVSYNRELWSQTRAQTTLAWGRNRQRPGETLDAFLLEATLVTRERHVVFGRIERAEKDELFEEDEPLAGQVFGVGKGSLGYRYDLPVGTGWWLGLGALASVYELPRELEPVYGSHPFSGMVFSRIRLR